MLYQIKDGTVSLGGVEVLSHINFEIKASEKVAVTGINGAGKTTLLRLLAGELDLDGDDRRQEPGIFRSRKLTVEMLRQQAFDDGSRTVEEELLAACPAGDLCDVERFAYEKEYDRLFAGFGFDKKDKKKRICQFSGGEQTKIALIRLLLERPDILLLDEPTNHLDLHSIEWLEDYLSSFKGAVLVVSHDRYFLDRVAQRILELEEGQITSYPGNYSYYVDQKQQLIEQLEAAKRRQDKEIARLSFTVERMKGWGMGNAKLMKRAFAMERRLQRIQRVKTIRQEHKMKNRFKEAGRSGDEVYQLSGLQAGYEFPFHQPFDAAVLRGERIAVIGDNGCGKTTLVSTILGQKSPYAGRVYPGAGLRLGYLPQVVEFARPDRTILDTMLYETNLDVQDSRDRLAAYGFKGESVFKEVYVLSGGEKARLKLCIFMNSEVNTLFLDEPTNHLDILTKEWIEDAIDDFNETMIFVSHDRYFINRFATRIWSFENGEIEDYIGTYEEYQQARARSGWRSWIC